MKSAVETLSPTRVRLSVEVPFGELKPSLDATYKTIAHQIALPGFRKGKIPRQLIDLRIGREAVLEQAVGDSLDKFYADALRENKVEPLGQPELDLDDVHDGEDVRFTVEVDIKPEITLPDYEGLEVSVDDADVSDEDVTEQIQGLRERFGTRQTAERPAADDDLVTLDLSAHQDGKEIADTQRNGLNYWLGSDCLLDGLDDAVRGKSAGETVTFRTTLASGEHGGLGPGWEEHLGEEADVTVAVQSVQEQQLPELDDDFAQLASEFDTLEELRADLRDRMERSGRLQQAEQVRDAVLDKVLELVEIPLPEQVVAEEVEARRSVLTAQLGQGGHSLERYLESVGQTLDEFNTELEQQVQRTMKAQFVLEEVAREENVTVSPEELTQAIVQRARQSGRSPQDYAQQVQESGQATLIVQDVARAKALTTLVEKAAVTDESGRQVDLSRLQPDGTFADPTAEEAGGEVAAAEEVAEAAESAGDAEPERHGE